MYKMGIIGLLLASLWACGVEKPIETGIKENPSTFCNPLNLDYRFMKIDGGRWYSGSCGSGCGPL